MIEKYVVMSGLSLIFGYIIWRIISDIKDAMAVKAIPQDDLNDYSFGYYRKHNNFMRGWLEETHPDIRKQMDAVWDIQRGADGE